MPSHAIFSFDCYDYWMDEYGLLIWTARICNERGFPSSLAERKKYLTCRTDLLQKNFPEFASYRDVAFYFKFFLMKDVTKLPPKGSYTQKEASLEVRTHAFDSVFAGPETPAHQYCHRLTRTSSLPPLQFQYQVATNKMTCAAFGRELSCKPKSENNTTPPPGSRFDSKADPAMYAVAGEPLATEQDILHAWELPSFGNLEVVNAPALGQHDGARHRLLKQTPK